MNIGEIITEADILVPNPYSPSEKIPWLNSINQEFFSLVKIPLIQMFSALANVKEYTLSSDVRAKNIDKVQTGLTQYRSMLEKNVNPAQNYWLFNDSNGKLTLNPAPYKAGEGIVRYFQISTTTFSVSNLTVSPDAPPEYHWIYVLGLSSLIAKAQDDIPKANNYSSEYLNALNVAAQNYVRG